MKIFCICSFLFFAGHYSFASEWSYGHHNGPSDWATSGSPICGDKFQSPINIAANQVVPDHNLKPLNFVGYQQTLDGAKITNNGHSVVVGLTHKDSFIVRDELNQTYNALQLHFHWTAGGGLGGGSEHTIDGKHYPVEMHIVHIKSAYSSLNDIRDLRDGLLVIGVMLEVDESIKSSPYSDVLAPMPNYKGMEATVSTSVKLSELLPSSGSFFRYYGSLTTPPCYEAVKWTVMQNSVKVPPSVLNRFKDQVYKVDQPDSADSLTTADLMGGNFRPVQALSGRIITEFLDFDKQEEDEHWTYAGPKKTSKWQRKIYLEEDSDHHNANFEKCSLNHQSPIDVDTTNLKQDRSHVGPISFTKDFSASTEGKLQDNGHTAVYTLSQDSLQFQLDDSQSTTYRALQLHFHWAPVFFSGFNNDLEFVGGSEHTVNGYHYPIEMHIVHKKLSGGRDDGSDDLAVLGVFFETTTDESLINKEADEALTKLTSNFMSVRYKGNEFNIYDGPVMANLLPSDKTYYRYMGSLTTPPCTEAVLWTVYSNTVKVSQERFFEFQRLLKGKLNQGNSTSAKISSRTTQPYISGNFRPTQDINDRTVYLYQEASTQTQIIFYVIIIGVTLLLLTIGVLIYKRAVSDSSSSRGKAKYSKGKTANPDLMQGETEVTNLE